MTIRRYSVAVALASPYPYPRQPRVNTLEPFPPMCRVHQNLSSDVAFGRPPTESGWRAVEVVPSAVDAASQLVQRHQSKMEIAAAGIGTRCIPTFMAAWISAREEGMGKITVPHSIQEDTWAVQFWTLYGTTVVYVCVLCSIRMPQDPVN